MTNGSGTVEKALSVLRFFTEQTPELGLSELSRMSGVNKATALRYLLALQSEGFIEQDSKSSKYFLGPAFGVYARIREASDPFARAAEGALTDLAGLTAETAHISAVIGTALETVGQVESTRSTRVILPHGEKLPLHATASGLALLAWAREGLLDEVLAENLTKFTEHTITTRQDLLACLEQTRRQGYSVGFQGYELDVLGLAAPYFGPAGHACGAVAVAMPISRFTLAIEQEISTAVRAAARKLTVAKNGIEPDSFPSDDTKFSQ